MSKETLEQNLRRHVYTLSHEIGVRNIEKDINYHNLQSAASYIKQSFSDIGYPVNTQPYNASYNGSTYKVENIEVVIKGAYPESIVIGAHYDTVSSLSGAGNNNTSGDSPGADDNASGVGGLIEIARHLYGRSFKKTIKLVAFPNEEEPYSLDQVSRRPFGDNMGSVQYAKRAKENGDVIKGMISLESIGYYDDTPGSQHFPFCAPIFECCFPNVGNYISFISNWDSRSFLKECVSAFENSASPFPFQSMYVPEWLINTRRSDHTSFSDLGYAAGMVTDIPNLRNPNYHQPTDTFDTLDYKSFTEAVHNLSLMAEKLGVPNDYHLVEVIGDPNSFDEGHYYEF